MTPNDILYKIMVYRWVYLTNQGDINDYLKKNLSENQKALLDTHIETNRKILFDLNLDTVEKILTDKFPDENDINIGEKYPLCYMIVSNLRYNGTIGKFTYEGCDYVNKKNNQQQIITNEEKFSYIKEVYEYTINKYEITFDLLHQAIAEEKHFF